MINRFLIAVAIALTPLSALAQSAVTLPIAANAVADIGNGPIKVRMIAGNASIFTSQGSGVGSTSGSSTALTLTGTPATAPIVGGLISGAGITSGTTIAAYNGTTGITLSAAMTVAGGTAVAWGAACPLTPPSNVIQASAMADYFIMYTQARVCAVSPGGPVNTLLIDPIFYDQSTVGSTPAAANPVDYGADPKCNTPSDAAFNAALAASNYVKFPPGHFCFSSKTTYATRASVGSTLRPGVTIECSGPEVTVLDWNNTTDGLEIDYTSLLASATVRGCTFATNQNGAGIALTFKQAALNSNAAGNRNTTVDNVQFRGSVITTTGWGTNINIQNVSNVVVNNVNIRGLASTDVGIEFIGNVGLSSPAVSLMVSNSNILSLNVGIRYDSFTQGVYVNNTNFTGSNTGILTPGGATGTLDNLEVVNSQFQSPTNAIILNTPVQDVNISGNLFLGPGTPTGAINLGTTGRYAVTGNLFSYAQGTGIVVTATSAGTGGTISGNQFNGLTTAITLGASTDFNTITANTFGSSIGTNISNSSTGTHNQIYGNPGYNPVGVTAAVNVGASPATITAGPTPETHYVKQSANFNAAITKGGNALCTTPSAAVPCVIELSPNEAMVVTWTTTTPTDTKDVH